MTFFYGSLHMDLPALTDWQWLVYMISVRTQDEVCMICREQWMLGTDGGGESQENPCRSCYLMMMMMMISLKPWTSFFLSWYFNNKDVDLLKNYTRSTGHGIGRLQPWREVWPSYHQKRGVLGKLHLMVRLDFCKSGKCGVIPLFSILTGSLWPGLVIPFRSVSWLFLLEWAVRIYIYMPLMRKCKALLNWAPQ